VVAFAQVLLVPQVSPAAFRRQVPVPLQPSSQALLPQAPSVPPAGTFVQVPTEPGTLQAWQVPPQAELQHLPSTQKLLAHWLLPLQSAPGPRLPPQSPPTQKLPEAHWESLPQVVAQRLPLQPRWGAQLVAAGAAQRPALQVDWAVCVLAPASQRACAHTVPFGYFWQAPMPLHLPLSPQLAAPASLQMFLGSTALAGVGVHLPRALGRAHDWQAPAQAFSQQTPSTQEPLPHWSPLVQS
jgi:hypothetical protein